MGAWGPKIYQDDLAVDIRDTYKDRLRRGKTGEQITKELLAEYEDVILDCDDGPVFWFAIADTQWEMGRLEEDVKENALYHIREGSNLKRWEEENPKMAVKRAAALTVLEEKLLSPQPPEKRVSQYKLYKCQWKKGDVYAYPLEGEYAKEKGLEGRYFIFYKIDEDTSWPGHIIPIVWVKITKNDKLPENLKEFNDLEYVQIFLSICDDPARKTIGTSYVKGIPVNGYVTDDCGFLPEYRLKLMNTSKRVIPKKLVYLGNWQNVDPPPIEFVPEKISIPGFLWKWFDEIMIKQYCGYNLGEFEIYAKRRKML